MNKKGKTKLFIILGICMISLLIASVFATAAGNNQDEKEVAQTGEISENVQEYVEQFAEKKGINPKEINDITQVDFNSLPKEVNIENVNEANLAIYQIDYNKTSEKQDKIFVITYSVEKLKSQGDLIIAQDKREFINFGFNKQTDQSEFMQTSTGVDGSLEKGYVMMRDGSITGISTNLETLSGEGNIEIIIYKNGEQIQFGNSFVVSSAEIKKDYDVQSMGTVQFKAGDVISAYVKISDGILWKDANTLVEITTSN